MLSKNPMAINALLYCVITMNKQKLQKPNVHDEYILTVSSLSVSQILRIFADCLGVLQHEHNQSVVEQRV